MPIALKTNYQVLILIPLETKPQRGKKARVFKDCGTNYVVCV